MGALTRCGINGPPHPCHTVYMPSNFPIPTHLLIAPVPVPWSSIARLFTTASVSPSKFGFSHAQTTVSMSVFCLGRSLRTLLGSLKMMLNSHASAARILSQTMTCWSTLSRIFTPFAIIPAQPYALRFSNGSIALRTYILLAWHGRSSMVAIHC